MSNVHSIRIEGLAPFNLPHQACNELRKDMAWMLMPGYGFKIEFSNKMEQIPNKHRGITTFYPFVLSGSEAMWENEIVKIVQSLIKAGCAISAAEIEDIEYPVPLHSVMDQLKGDIVVSPNGTPMMVKDSKWPD